MNMKKKLMKVYLKLVRDEIYGRGIGGWKETRDILREVIGIEEEVIQRQIYQPINEIYSGILDMRKAKEYDDRAIGVIDRFEEMYEMLIKE